MGPRVRPDGSRADPRRCRRAEPVTEPMPAPDCRRRSSTTKRQRSTTSPRSGRSWRHARCAGPIHFRRAPKPRVRRVTRVVRHVDTWSVFKVALIFNVFFYAVTLVAGVLLWQVAYATGTIDNVEKFFEGFGWETFDFNGGQIFHNAWIAGLFVAVGFTGLGRAAGHLVQLDHRPRRWCSVQRARRRSADTCAARYRTDRDAASGGSDRRPHTARGHRRRRIETRSSPTTTD